VLANRGDGSFRARRDYETGSGPDSVAIGDLNGDRKPDVATANYDTDTISVLVNRGDGSFRARQDHRTGSNNPNSVAIGDLNGDGKPELAIASYFSIVSVLANTSGLGTVPKVTGKTLPAAERAIARANCRVGTIRRAYSKTVKSGRVISQSPKRGRVLPNRGRVNLIVSRGRRR
jgi:hypothetical protein